MIDISDIKADELNTIKTHIEVNSSISFENMTEVWREENGTLCVKYGDIGFWRYNNNGEWW